MTSYKGHIAVVFVPVIISLSVDYISGLIVAGVFKNSPKTDTGSLESKAGWKGLCRKCMTLIFVLVAYRLDLVIGTNYIRDAVIIAFIANETISLVEKSGSCTFCKDLSTPPYFQVNLCLSWDCS